MFLITSATAECVGKTHRHAHTQTRTHLLLKQCRYLYPGLCFPLASDPPSVFNIRGNGAWGSITSQKRSYGPITRYKTLMRGILKHLRNNGHLPVRQRTESGLSPTFNNMNHIYWIKNVNMNQSVLRTTLTDPFIKP